ncbi:TPA: hypothetical protein R4Y84_005688 [Klebsiella michiganensis]|uniref:hypothetical protein n=1 Tax=Klebsiella pasteurii TaxID=2587529 RepID=UPI000D7E206B|nr:hypothetical protein [Klebsiella pasteurii]AWT17953.1 hypothetical protein DMP75_05110 [Klebsiella michiganensis]MDM4222707.1 hypothetical protein [Klebsiella pasteurii]HCF7935473.1 hypothetical protein [Klebsiella michiganensis]HED2510403.1 hypothetical protein [Klebsiella michiganensis]
MISNIRYATRDDISGWYEKVPGTMRAIALEVNGEVVAFGGVMRRDHRLVAFMEMKSDAPKYPVSMVRAACKAIKEIISTYTQPVYAVVDEEWKSAPRFLEYCGFIDSGISENIKVFGGMNHVKAGVSHMGRGMGLDKVSDECTEGFR